MFASYGHLTPHSWALSEPRGMTGVYESTKDGKTLPAGELGEGDPACWEVWSAGQLSGCLMGASVQGLYHEKPILSSLMSEGNFT